jgi:hypothetical protein
VNLTIFLLAGTSGWPKDKCDYGVCGWTEAPYGGNPSIPNQDITQPLFK